MYRNIILTLLLIAVITIAIEWCPRSIAVRNEPLVSESAEKCLDRKIPSLVMHHATLRETIDQIQKATGVEFSVDWPSIPKWDKEFLDVELHDIPLGHALSYILKMNRDYINGVEQIDFEAVNGVVRIAESDRFPQGTMTLRIYDVRDLLSDQYWGYPAGPDPSQSYFKRTDALELMVESIAGNTNWDMERMRGGTHAGTEAGGNADMRFASGRLLILQTTRGHRLVEAALERLRNGGIPAGRSGH